MAVSEALPAGEDRPDHEVEATSLGDWARVVDPLPEAVLVASAEDVIVYANPAAEALLGWERDGLRGRPLTSIVPERFRGQHLASFQRFAATAERRHWGRTLQVSALRRDMTEVPVEVLVATAELSGDRVVIGMVREVTERSELEGAGQITDLVLAALAEESTLDEAFPRVLGSLASSLNWDVALLWMLDETEEALRPRSSWVAPDVAADEFVEASRRAFGPGEGLPGRVWARGRPEWIPDIGGDANFPRRGAAAASRLQSALAFPVVAGRRTLGVIELFSRQPRVPSGGLLVRLAALGSELGHFVEHRIAEEALRLQTALLQTQSESGLEGQMVVSPEGEVISLNRRCAEMWGLPADILERGQRADPLRLAAERVLDREAFLAEVGRLQTNREPVRGEVVLADGRVFDRYGAPLFAGGDYLGCALYFRDVTDQKRIERELVKAGERSASLARTLQQSLLPPELPYVRGLEMAARYHPAGAGLDVGGDFYDVFRIQRGSVGIVIGDVCGKGAPAASLTALVRYTLRAAAMQTRSPAQALSIVNAAMVRQQPEEASGKFATAVYAALRRSRGVNTLTVSSGGHPLPLLRRRDGSIEAAARPGTLLGLFAAVQLEDYDVELEPGDAIVFFTDGVIEAKRGGDFFGEERLRYILRGTAGWPAADIAAAVETAALGFQGGEVGDDIAVLVVALR